MKGFVLSGDDTVIDEWERTAPSKAVAKLDSRLTYMVCTPHTEWPYDYAHKLTNGEGLWEIKFQHQNVQYRPLFYFGPFPEEFTILEFCTERDDQLVPDMGRAKVRMKAVMTDYRKARMHDG